MRIVVTGCQGQLVQSLVEAAAGKGVVVVPLGRPECDLTHIEQLSSVIDASGADVVVNAAAYTAVDKAETDQDTALLVNGAAAGAIAVACERRSVPIIQISTDFVFDGTKTSAYVETDTPSPISVYGASKMLGEQLVATGAQRHLILRPSWVISPFGHNFAKTMLRLGAERPKLTVVDDQHGAPTYAPHLADAILALSAQVRGFNADDPRWGIYHVVNQGETTWCGIAREMFRQAAVHGVRSPEVAAIPTEAYPLPARRPKNSRLDCGKLQRTFGIELPAWQAGVQACVDRLVAAKK